MNEEMIELPLMKFPIKVKTLKDYTNICTCKLPEAKKFCLVIDSRVDTVMFYHFDTRKDLLKAVMIKADTVDAYLDELFELFPNLKVWLPSIPFGEPGDLIHVRLMDNREFYTQDIHWEHDQNTYQFHFKLGPDYDEIIKVDDIRFLHVLYTDETFMTLQDLIEDYEETGNENLKEGISALTFVFAMAEVHIKNYNKRKLIKQLDEQDKIS